MPVEKDIDLNKPLSETDIQRMESEANRLEELAKKAHASSEKAVSEQSKEDQLLNDAIKKVEQLEKEADKAEKARTRIGKSISEVNKLAEHRTALSNIGGGEDFETNQPFEGMGGREAFSGMLKTGRTAYGTGQESSPMGNYLVLKERLEELEKLVKEKEKERKKEEAERRKKLMEQEKIVSTMQQGFQQSVAFTSNPFQFLTSKALGLIGGAGIAGFIAIIGIQVAEQVFDLIKKEFEAGGRFDIRKQMLDRDREITELSDILDRRTGRVFFTSDNELKQGAPQVSNTERLRDRTIRYQALHLGE